jgi:shikimate kinase
MAEPLVLIGMMGSGKTTVGRELAGRLGWAFLDSDAMVEASTGSTVAELFAERGEDGFRSEETRVLVEAMGATPPAVVAAAGGAVLSRDNRALLTAGGTVVWLRADPSTLAGRLGSGAGRPLLGDEPAARLVELDAVRRPLYEEVADVVVDVDDLDPSRVVDRILALTAFERSRP